MQETQIDYDGIIEAVTSRLAYNFKFLCKDGNPIIIPSLNYDFCEYYVFVSTSEGVIVHGVEKNLKRSGWFVYEAITTFGESEFKEIFGEFSKRN